MTDDRRWNLNLPPEQEAIRARCFHPTGTFVEFKKEEIEQSIAERFEQVFSKYPDRIAVKTRSQALSYQELNRAANGVAHAVLARQGDGNEPVALLLTNAAWIAAGTLGVLKAGKIYVPLDPSHPFPRMNYIKSDIQAKLILTDNLNVSAATALAQGECELLNLEEFDSSSSPENLGLNISPDSLAYVRYTSGSTGEPKGVMEKHRNLLHVVMRQTNAFHICADDRLMFLGAWGKHIFRGLLNGAALYPFRVKEEGLADLAQWLAEEEVTIYHSIPSVFRHFVDTLTGSEIFPNLRIVRLCGEPLVARNAELFKKYFSPKCVLVNELGSTEGGTIAHYLVDPGKRNTADTVPVGYADQDVKILLLDGGTSVGPGEIGEIAVKSRYLFPGYWRRPDLTRTAFLADPEDEDERIYLTGDVGLMRPDGSLMHLGRKDLQAKIRGNKVEPTEIEMALLRHSAIKEVVVVARGDGESDQRLVAYLVPGAKSAPPISELRSFLAAKLPEYMIPSAFVVLNAMPVTPSGKLDRRALPDPGSSRPEMDTPYVSPRRPIEEELAQIWAEVLFLDRVGIHDNFLELGGHSLAAARVVSRVIKAFQVNLPLQSLFQSRRLLRCWLSSPSTRERS
jgi:amino acid adenylation domain-containing protein